MSTTVLMQLSEEEADIINRRRSRVTYNQGAVRACDEIRAKLNELQTQSTPSWTSVFSIVANVKNNYYQ